MKKIVLITFVILLTGCVPVRQDGPALDAKKVLKCPELVEAAAKNLEQIKIDLLLVKAWKSTVLSDKMQPCNACQKLNTAAYVLNDANGIYKPAMLEFIKKVREEEPNEAPTYKPYIGESKISSKDMEKYALAQQYMRAIEDLQNFLSTEIRMPALEAKNFVLDNYSIPLLQEAEKVQDPNQTQVEVIEPEN